MNIESEKVSGMNSPASTQYTPHKQFMPTISANLNMTITPPCNGIAPADDDREVPELFRSYLGKTAYKMHQFQVQKACLRKQKNKTIVIKDDLPVIGAHFAQTVTNFRPKNLKTDQS